MSCCLLFAIIVSSIFWASAKVELAFTRNIYAQKVENHTNTLKQHIISEDIYDKQYTADTWLLLQSKLVKLLRTAPDLTPHEQTIQNSIISHSNNVKRLFDKINANKLKNANETIKKHLKARLMTQLEIIRADSEQLSITVQDDIQTEIKRQVFIIIGILAVSFVLLFYGSFRLTYIFRTSLGEVKAAFKKNHSGHFQKIKLSKSTVEFEAVVTAFNLMNHKLSETTVSLAQMKKTVAEKTQDLEQLSRTDPLTQVANRRALYERGNIELARKNRSTHQLSLMMLDCDYFKRVNDEFGHRVGDKLLKHICSICHQEIRDIDFLARYGGEEFIIVLPDCDLNGGAEIAKRIQTALTNHCLKIDDDEVCITVSIGISTLCNKHQNFEQLINDADKAMYMAKEKGRNRIEVSNEKNLH